VERQDARYLCALPSSPAARLSVGMPSTASACPADGRRQGQRIGGAIGHQPARGHRNLRVCGHRKVRTPRL